MARKKTTTIVEKENSVDIIHTEFDDKKLSGRKNVDYSKLYGDDFRHYLTEKINRIYRYNSDLIDYGKNNDFDYFITLSNITPKHRGTILEKIRKKDSSSAYICLAAWTITSDLHYHIMLKTSLSKEEVEKLLTKCNSKVKEIYDQPGLINYFRKNLNYDTIYVLKQTENTTLDINLDELREKQLEILYYSKILAPSTDIKKTKVNKIKNATKDQVEKAIKDCNYDKTIEYKKVTANVKIDKYVKKEGESITTTTAAVSPKVEENTTSTTTVEVAPAGAHNFIAKLNAPHKDAEEIMKEQAQAVADEMETFIKKVLRQEENKLKRAENSHKINIDNIFKEKEWQPCLQKESLIKQQHSNWWTKVTTS